MRASTYSILISKTCKKKCCIESVSFTILISRSSLICPPVTLRRHENHQRSHGNAATNTYQLTYSLQFSIETSMEVGTFMPAQKNTVSTTIRRWPMDQHIADLHCTDPLVLLGVQGCLCLNLELKTLIRLYTYIRATQDA